ncbi:MAG: DnaA regulatory inactivator Hda [Gammaproteobacteria bacterium]|nr:MAG: DnaA regulatory inactivator Hda [Gammaproteobacteria bacterium]
MGMGGVPARDRLYRQRELLHPLARPEGAPVTAQLPLGLELRTPSRLADYVAGDDGQVLALLAQQRSGDGEAQLYLTGPRCSGRSHLLLGQCAAARDQGLRVVYLPAAEHSELSPEMLEGLEAYDLLAVDDVDALAGQPAWERALFNLYNQARDQGARLLFSATRPAAGADFELADLRTRLGWGLTYHLKPLNDTQRHTLLQRLAQRRGLSLAGEVADYLLARCPRDPCSLIALIDRLDRDSLAEQRRLSIPFVRSRIPGLR